MAQIIPLHGDAHARTQRLLPWRANGTLDGEELAQVDAHLADCAECRQDLEAEQALAREVRALPDHEQGWAAMRARVDGVRPPPGRRGGRSLLGRRIPVGWALAAQAASLAVLAMLFALALTARPHGAYRTLGAAPSAASGDLVVIFAPDAPEQSVRTILTQNRARIVDGPTATGAYVLQAPAGRRAAVLARLRGDRHVSLAEPIDGDAR